MVYDLAVFADLGTEVPTASLTASGAIIRLTRNGYPIELQVSADTGAILETVDENSTKHASFRALLASERYGALRTWAARQKAFLSQEQAEGALIPLTGSMNNSLNKFDLSYVDVELSASHLPNTTRVLLIDGPAGIGKTQFIFSLSKLRADNFSTHQHSLIFHIQSRGRTLSYLTDLMAFSLQRLRVDVTFDQVPILAKHGLVTIAVDGFDELADPEGYGMAWSQVSELVATVRGEGTLILAGRETFIGRTRLLRDVPALRAEIDDISVFTLNAPTKAEALNFLELEGWTKAQRDSIEDLLEPSSLALRPFFLRTLADEAVADKIDNTLSTNILSILIDAMVEREIAKFGEAVERELNPDDLRKYVSVLMAEVARDMAENTTVAVSDSTLAFLVDVALPKDITDSTTRLLKSRSQVIAFLTNDDRPGYRRFHHEKFYEYFLSKVIIENVRTGLAIKPLARNLFASSFLETFGAIISGSTAVEEARSFLAGAVEMSTSYMALDRTKRNLGALLIASLGIADLVPNFSIDSIETDEVRFSGTATASTLTNVVISQFDCRGADISEVTFNNCVVISLIGDDATLLPDTFPIPSRIQDVGKGADAIRPEDINQWIADHLRNPPIRTAKLLPDNLRNHEAVRLLQKVCRLRQYWLRRGNDIHAVRILDSMYWPKLEGTLLKNDLLKVELRQASGTDARFMHVKKAYEILDENQDNPNVVQFYRDLVSEIT
jgi:hypothetical protein